MFDFRLFPGTNFNRINLDWIFSKLKELQEGQSTVTEAAEEATAAAEEATTAAAAAMQSASDAIEAIETVTETAEDAQARARAAELTAARAESSANTANAAVSALDTRLQTAEGNITTLDDNVTDVQGDVATLQDDVATLQGDVAGILNAVYPVGSIYMSIISSSPATLFGGTWERIKDTFILSAGDTYAAGTTGGEAEHTLTAAEAAQKAVSIASSGGHKHDVIFKYDSGQTAAGTAKLSPFTSGSQSTTNVCIINDNTGQHTHNITGADATVAHNNMPPYLAVYVWKRTA